MWYRHSGTLDDSKNPSYSSLLTCTYSGAFLLESIVHCFAITAHGTPPLEPPANPVAPRNRHREHKPRYQPSSDRWRQAKHRHGIGYRKAEGQSHAGLCGCLDERCTSRLGGHSDASFGGNGSRATQLLLPPAYFPARAASSLLFMPIGPIVRVD